MKYKILTFCGLDNSAEISTIEAKDEDEAHEIIEEGMSNYDVDILLNAERLANLKKALAEGKE